MVRLIALDMDGTITQHKTQLSDEAAGALDCLRARYHLVIVGAGSCARIHNQLKGYPVDVIGCYGMEISRFDEGSGKLALVERAPVPPVDRDRVNEAAAALRARFGLQSYAGDSVEFHPSGMLTFALLGTKAALPDKLAFDPDRLKRRPMYPAVCEAFSDYTVFIGGSSSFDIVPRPYDKCHALKRYCALFGYAADEVVFMGDDYGPGGNDEQVYRSEFRFVPVDDYRDFPAAVARLV